MQEKLNAEIDNLTKEKKKMQSTIHAAKSENSRIHSKLQDTYDEVSRLNENIQKLKNHFKQYSQQFMQNFPLLKQKVEEYALVKSKANQDWSSLMCEYDELTKKLNALLYEMRSLKVT